MFKINVMKNFLIKLTVVLFSVALISCNKNDYKKMDNGALMKFYTVNEENQMPELGDLVLIDVTQKIADSVLFSSEMLGEPFEMIIEEPSFVGDIMCALMSMHLGDHASLIFAVDSLFQSIGEPMPEFIEPGTLTEMDIVLKEIVNKDVLEEEMQNELQSLKSSEEALLAPYYNNSKYTITEDSLIITKMKQGKGRLPKAGDILKVYFTYNILDGDTVFSFTEGKPYELVFGDMALGQGFHEALSLLSKGAEAEYIIPSSLAWGEDGFQNIILPYTPFKFNVTIVDIMTSDEYEAEQKLLMEKEEAENNKRLQEEPKKIAEYVKKHNITVDPTSSGLYYIETEAGTGDSVKAGDMVSVHYTIYNIDGVKIESSLDYGQPIPFVYGDNQMIPGIEEAVSYMRVGGKSTIIAPSRLGFGNIKVDDNLPANLAVVIDLELVNLQR